VEHRVEVLADRSEAEVKPPATAGSVSNLVPLPEILSEIAQSGPAGKTVEQNYNRVIASLGPELSILQEVPVEDISRADSSLLAEAITRLRAGKVMRDAGYDGEYGVIRLFGERELKLQSGGGLLFETALGDRGIRPPRERKKVSGTPAEPAMAPATGREPLRAQSLPSSASFFGLEVNEAGVTYAANCTPRSDLA